MTDLNELERLLREATAGPWKQRETLVLLGGAGGFDLRNCPRAAANAALIAALRNHAAELIRDARRYRWLIKCPWFQNESEYRLHMKPEHIFPEDVGPYIDAAIAQEQS